MKYLPLYTITPAIVNLVAEIGETIGRYSVLAEQNLTPRLRRENRIRTIQAAGHREQYAHPSQPGHGRRMDRTHTTRFPAQPDSALSVDR